MLGNPLPPRPRSMGFAEDSEQQKIPPSTTSSSARVMSNSCSAGGARPGGTTSVRRRHPGKAERGSWRRNREKSRPVLSTLQAKAAPRALQPVLHRRRPLETKQDSKPAQLLTRLTTPLPLAPYIK